MLASYLNIFQSRASPKLESRVDHQLNGLQLWSQHSQHHGLFNEIHDSERVCHDFFGLWPSDCMEKNDELDERLRVISSQMVAMNSTFTLFTTGSRKCNFEYGGIKVVVFNATDLLVEYGFGIALQKMSEWKKTRYTRISDILRICLAHKHGKSYLDTDVTFLFLNSSVYEKSYAGAAMWGNLKNAIEITNAAFCLPNAILMDMARFQLNRIVRGGDQYFYTELGPSMFHNVGFSSNSIIG